MTEVTVQDLLDMKEMKNKAVVINDGKIVGFEEE
jgi:hypothetical protein